MQSYRVDVRAGTPRFAELSSGRSDQEITNEHCRAGSPPHQAYLEEFGVPAGLDTAFSNSLHQFHLQFDV